jgi:hypothetical protein
VEGTSAHLYTVLSGWAFRYKLLSDGRRQILNYSMPGDLIGAGQPDGRNSTRRGVVADAAGEVFERENLHELYRTIRASPTTSPDRARE